MPDGPYGPTSGDPAEDPFDRGAGPTLEPDYYAVLGLRPEAGHDDVRRAYHRLAKLWHPDRYTGAAPELRARAERRMRALTAAYAVLGDPRLRWDYDTRRGYAAPVFAPWRGSGMRAAYARGGPGGIPHDGVWSGGGIAKEETGGDPNGAGWFIGLLGLILCLGSLIATLQAGGGPGSYIGIVAAVLFGALAFWSFSAGSTPARLAAEWLEGDPAPRPGARWSRYDFAAAAASASRSSSRASSSSPAGAPDAGGDGGKDTEAAEASPPPTLDPDVFDRLVGQALAAVPPEFAPYMANIVVEVRPEPTAEERRVLDVREGGLLLGLYRGVDLTRRGVGGVVPEEIAIFQGPIERYCGDDPARIREQVRRTVLHELAHHFGIDHDQMPHWIR
jgi:predicted Zn-dependent protease with MMP-like domain